MGHLYPLARDARRALEGAAKAARTRADAERLAGADGIETLQTDWLTIDPAELDSLLALAEKAVGEGFVQRYEDAAGQPVLAVSYWRLAEPKPTGGTEAGAQETGARDTGPPEPASPVPDHTDDLYFRAGRTLPRRPRKSRVDPRQLDLFSGPDQHGFERRDPDNPAIILTDEEGDGTTFGD